MAHRLKETVTLKTITLETLELVQPRLVFGREIEHGRSTDPQTCFNEKEYPGGQSDAPKQ